MPPHPSPTYKRLRDYIAERMRMSHIYQPLMLMELLGRHSPATAQDIARRILGEDVTQIDYYTERVKRMVGRVLTGNGITRYGERDALLQLCRQRLVGFRVRPGVRRWLVSLLRSLRLRPSLTPPQPDQQLGDVSGAHKGTGPLRVLRCQAVVQQTPHQRALSLHQPD